MTLMSEPVTLHTLDRRVSAIEETMDLKIQNAVNAAVIRLLLGIGGLLALQTLFEKVIA